MPRRRCWRWGFRRGSRRRPGPSQGRLLLLVAVRKPEIQGLLAAAVNLQTARGIPMSSAATLVIPVSILGYGSSSCCWLCSSVDGRAERHRLERSRTDMEEVGTWSGWAQLLRWLARQAVPGANRHSSGGARRSFDASVTCVARTYFEEPWSRERFSLSSSVGKGESATECRSLTLVHLHSRHNKLTEDYYAHY